MWSRPYLGIMVERNCWTLFVVVSSHTSIVFVSTCEKVWGTLKPLQTLVMKGPIMLSNLVLSECFHIMQPIDKSAKIQLDLDCNKQVWPLPLTFIAWKSNLEYLAYRQQYYSPCRILVEISNLWVWELRLLETTQRQVACCQVSWTGCAFLDSPFS